MHRQSLTKTILLHLAQEGKGFLSDFLPRKYPETRLTRKLLGLDSWHRGRPRFPEKTVATLLSRLQKQGLVLKKGSQRKALWFLTEKGRKAISSDLFLPPRDDVPRLVVFDIPEEERKKRDRIRHELAACDFRALQRSVWIGYRPLPDSFLDLLLALRAQKYVHIVSIQQRGTLDKDRG